MGSSTALSHARASTAPCASLGTPTFMQHLSFATSAETSRVGSVGLAFIAAPMASFIALLSDPTCRSTTTNFSPAAQAAATACVAAATALALFAPAIALLASTIFLPSVEMRSRSLCFVVTEMTALSRSTLKGFSSASIFGPTSNFSIASIRFVYAAPSAIASLARSPVKPTIRRMPLAMPSSVTRANACASFELLRCVPPQNSIDISAHFAFEGSLSS
mmetsp:Transcript_16360/g.41741  ORF Transcript_16360/g.41741 Transcript_16360/m.41741 type:complete len:219 (+) Transcript_16360:138-794(+)